MYLFCVCFGCCGAMWCVGDDIVMAEFEFALLFVRCGVNMNLKSLRSAYDLFVSYITVFRL